MEVAWIISRIEVGSGQRDQGWPQGDGLVEIGDGRVEITRNLKSDETSIDVTSRDVGLQLNCPIQVDQREFEFTFSFPGESSAFVGGRHRRMGRGGGRD